MPELTMNHPVSSDDLRNLTPVECRAVADNLFRTQCRAFGSYLANIVDHGWGDDDTDYLPASAHALTTLQFLAYEGTPEDIITFLHGAADREHRNDSTLAAVAGALDGSSDEVLSYTRDEDL